MKKLLTALLLSFTISLASAQSPNISVAPLTSAARTAATVTSADFGGDQGGRYKGGHFIVDVTTFTSGTYTPKIQGKDPVSGSYYDVLVGPAINSTGITVLKIYPGINAILNGASSDILPQIWRIVLTGASTPNMVISVTANLDI